MLIAALANKPIKCLDISKNFLSSKASKSIAEFVQASKTLKSLNLSYNTLSLTEQGLKYLFQNFLPWMVQHSTLTKYGGITALVERYFDSNNTLLLVNACSNNSTIASLDLSHSMHISFWIDALLCALQCKKLSSLHLYDNNLNLRDARAIANIIRFNKTLVSLNISENIIQDHGMCLVCDALCCNAALKFLDVSENALTVYSAVAFEVTIQCNSTLTCLALGSNLIGDEGCKHLAKALSVNKTLASLYMRHNIIGDDGAKALAAALRNNKTLLQLDLSFNNIKDEGAMALLSALHNNTTLMDLFAPFNPISDAKIEECFAFNSDIIYDHEFLTYVESPSSNWTIYVYSIKYMSCEKHVLISKEHDYNKWQTGSKIDAHYMYDSLIPNDQQDCFKYYAAKQLESINLVT